MKSVTITIDVSELSYIVETAVRSALDEAKAGLHDDTYRNLVQRLLRATLEEPRSSR